jgi:hypothetical protein
MLDFGKQEETGKWKGRSINDRQTARHESLTEGGLEILHSDNIGPQD